MTTETFYVVAVDETDNWTDIAAHNIEAVFGLYLVREGEATHLCSLTPNSAAIFLRNAFMYEDGDAKAKAFAEAEEYNDGGDPATYLKFFRPDRMDSRFYTVSSTVDPADVDFDEAPGDDADTETREAYHTAIWDHAREYEQGNTHDPAIIFPGTYAAWKAEKENAPA